MKIVSKEGTYNVKPKSIGLCSEVGLVEHNEYRFWVLVDGYKLNLYFDNKSEADKMRSCIIKEMTK